MRQTLPGMEPLLIGPPNDGLSIRDLSRDASGAVDRAMVRITKDGLLAETWVYANEATDSTAWPSTFRQ